MYTLWTDHLKDTDEKERFVNQVIAAKPVLRHLMTLIDKDIEALDKVELSVKQFDQPNWANKQAFYNGSRSAYQTIKKIIDLDEQKRSLYDRKPL